MKDIDKYMTPSEAAERWGLNPMTVQNKTKPSLVKQDELQDMIDKGLIKYYQKPGGQRKEWIISVDAMEIWFGKLKD